MSEDARRKNTRYNVHWPCRLLLPNKTIVSGKVKNISLGGVGVDVSNMMPVGQQLSFEVRPMVAGKTYLVRAKCEVTFSMILGGGGGFSHGLRFSIIPDAYKNEVANLIKVLASDK